MDFAELELTERELRRAESFKWTKYPADVLPLWVADMDFRVAPGIRRALAARLEGTVGYGLIEAGPELTSLLRRKLEAQGFVNLPETGWIGFLNGVVQGLYGAVLGLTSVGDDVLTITPIYPPFLSAIKDHGRHVRAVPLIEGDGRWQFDWAAMEAAVTPSVRLLMLCHPHNPCGRVWTREELSQIAAFAERHRLWVVSDELHADLTLDGGFVPFVSVAAAELQQRTVTLTGPCKAYNTAGLGIGAMISHNPELITRLKKAMAGVMGHPGTLSVSMWRAALEDDGGWLQTVLALLRENRRTLVDFVQARLPGVKCFAPEATYLAWLDYRAHPMAADIGKYLLDHAKVALNDGPMFGMAGSGYRGFVRLNFATSRQILAEALERIARAHVVPGPPLTA